MATYPDYGDGNYYDPSNITLNIQDWEEPENPPEGAEGGEQAQDYNYQT